MSVFQKRLKWLKAQDVYIAQHVNELRGAWALVYEMQPSTFLEIGSLQGGSLYVYAGACKPRAHIISIDVPRSHSHSSVLQKVLRQLGKEGYQVSHLSMPSHGDVTVECLKALTRHVDALHVDGNHKYTMVKGDYMRYEPFVRSPGLIILHDIAGALGVKKLWREIKASGARTEEWKIEDGVGVVFKEPKNAHSSVV